MKKIIVGNWKMYGDPAMAAALAKAVALYMDTFSGGVQVVICPPAVLLAEVSKVVSDAKCIQTGGQTCHFMPEGAFTGDVSAQMLKNAGANYVIVGHSERRQQHHEADEQIKTAAGLALKAGLTPIICVGESEEERKSGQAYDVVRRQVMDCLPEEAKTGDFVLAYEPVWAIGSGATPTLLEIEAMHAHILCVAARQTGKDIEVIATLYGGSVKAANAREILHASGVNGVLVGGASLKADEFCRIISAAL